MSYAEVRRQVLAMLPKAATGAEIGVWKGDFSAAILDIAQPRKLHLIDPWVLRDDPGHAAAWYGSAHGADIGQIHRGVLARFGDAIAAGQVEVHRAPSAHALAALPDGTLDFVYVDGDHAYEAVRQDLALSFAKTRPGGLICIDDHITGKWWQDGIVRAVNEFLGAHPAGLKLRFAAESQVVIARR